VSASTGRSGAPTCFSRGTTGQGDRVVLMGYSRGAYAVRSLAGLIDRMGLLRAAQIDEETLDRVYISIARRRKARGAGAEGRALPRPCRDRVSRRLRHGARAGHPLADPLALRPMPHPYHSHALGPFDPDRAPRARAGRDARRLRAGALGRGARARRQRRGAADVVPRRPWRCRRAARRLRARPAPVEHRAVWMLVRGRGGGPAAAAALAARYITDASAPASGTRRGAGRLVHRPARAQGGPRSRPSASIPARAGPRPVGAHRPDPAETLRVVPFSWWRGSAPAPGAGIFEQRKERSRGQAPRGLARSVGSAAVGSSGQGCLGYCARMSLRTSA
jgi:hypothetical protein